MDLADHVPGASSLPLRLTVELGECGLLMELDMPSGISTLPLYYRVREAILAEIESGRWPDGTRIPTEREIMRRFGVSRATVREALGGLERMGIIERKQGSGTFVAPRKLVHDLHSLSSAARSPTGAKRTDRIRPLVLEVVPCNESLARRLLITPGSSVYSLERVVYADVEPIMILKSYLPTYLFPGFENIDLEHRLLYDVIRDQYGFNPTHQVKEIEAVALDRYEASHLLQRAGTPALLIEYVTWANGEVPIEFRKMLVRGDRCKSVVIAVGTGAGMLSFDGSDSSSLLMQHEMK